MNNHYFTTTIRRLILRSNLFLSVSGILLVSSLEANAQVGIGTLAPDASAQLEIRSESKGLLIPRVSREIREKIASPATGLLVYQLDGPSGFYYYDGTAWLSLTSSGAAAASTIIPFSSGVAVEMTIGSGIYDAMKSVSAIAFGNSLSGFGIDEITGRTELPATNSGAVSNLAFISPRAGTIKSISAYFSNAMSQNLGGSVVAVKAQLYRSQPPYSYFEPITDAEVVLPGMSGQVEVGTVFHGVKDELKIQINAADRLLMVFSVQGSSLSEPMYTVKGFASAGLSIE